jgi:hypothetical protein
MNTSDEYTLTSTDLTPLMAGSGSWYSEYSSEYREEHSEVQ